jgi:hypothetical protein
MAPDRTRLRGIAVRDLRPNRRGLGTDVVRVLCHYGLVVRGLHRLQVETLADNAAMIRAATQAGFVTEATLRRSAWVNGDFVDEVILGLLASEWTRTSEPQPGTFCSVTGELRGARWPERHASSPWQWIP